jgi:hypothetical protein
MQEYRNFWLLAIGQGLLRLGDGLYVTALTWVAWTLTGSLQFVATVTLASNLPVVVGSVIGASFADRYNRKRIMMGCDLVRALLLVTGSRCAGRKKSHHKWNARSELAPRGGPRPRSARRSAAHAPLLSRSATGTSLAGWRSACTAESSRAIARHEPESQPPTSSRSLVRQFPTATTTGRCGGW